MKDTLRKIAKKINLRYQLLKTNLQLSNVRDRISNHDEGLYEFGPISPEFSMVLAIRRISMAERRDDLLYRKNNLESQLYQLK